MFSDKEFLYALIRSNTFLFDIAVYGGIALFSFFGIIFFLKKYTKLNKNLKKLHQCQRGSASAVDFVMVMPFFMVVIAIIVQLTIIVNTSLIVHYAAYSAARSARVWAWDMDNLLLEKLYDELPVGQAALKFQQSRAQKSAERAAKYVLIAASPTSTRLQTNPNQNQLPDKALKLIAEKTNKSKREAVLKRKANYAYDSNNVKVEVKRAVEDIADDLLENATYSLDYLQSGTAWPIKAKVEYRMYLSVPIASLIGEKNAGDGRYYKWIDAEVTLL